MDIDDKLALDVINPVKKYLSVSQIAEQYFGKSRGWLHQRLNNDKVNGNPVYLKKDEILVFASALDDVSRQLAETAEKLKQLT